MKTKRDIIFDTINRILFTSHNSFSRQLASTGKFVLFSFVSINSTINFIIFIDIIVLWHFSLTIRWLKRSHSFWRLIPIFYGWIGLNPCKLGLVRTIHRRLVKAESLSLFLQSLFMGFVWLKSRPEFTAERAGIVRMRSTNFQKFLAFSLFFFHWYMTPCCIRYYCRLLWI